MKRASNEILNDDTKKKNRNNKQILNSLENSEFSAHSQEIDQNVDHELIHHNSVLRKKFPSREERFRRDIQRKIQSYVKELREKGKDSKEILRLKKKFKMKLLKGDRKFDLEELEFTDIEIICKDCNMLFIFSAKEQKFYKGKGFSPAVRCKTCTNAKKNRMSYLNA